MSVGAPLPVGGFESGFMVGNLTPGIRPGADNDLKGALCRIKRSRCDPIPLVLVIRIVVFVP